MNGLLITNEEMVSNGGPTALESHDRLTAADLRVASVITDGEVTAPVIEP